MAKAKDEKYKKLFTGLFLDIIGILTSSWVLPVVGDFADVIWAPFAGWYMTRLYKGNIGKMAGLLTFIEEIVPGLDIIPSFTLMWLYTYVFQSKKVRKVIKIK